MRKYFVVSLVLCSYVWGQAKQFVKVDAPVVALTHVRIIDGTGAAAGEDQTLLISKGKICRSVLRPKFQKTLKCSTCMVTR